MQYHSKVFGLTQDDKLPRESNSKTKILQSLESGIDLWK